MIGSTLRAKRWTRLEYERLIDLGAFRSGDHVELLGGNLMVCEPQGALHMTGIPEARLESDREHKGSVYARAQVPEYWIINLVDKLLEVYRNPIVDSTAPFGWRYGSISRLGAGDSVGPMAAGQCRVAVADLLPSQLR